MGKGLSKGMIDMYIEMVEKEYSPLISMLEAKTSALAPRIAKQVKKDLGIYNLLMEEKALETRLKEIKQELKAFTNRRCEWRNGEYREGRNKIDEEINNRLEALNAPLCQAKAAQNAMVKNIKLMAAGDDVKAIFENMAAEIALMADQFKDMPLLTMTDHEQIEADDDNEAYLDA